MESRPIDLPAAPPGDTNYVKSDEEHAVGHSDLELARGVLRGEEGTIDEFARRLACVPRIVRWRNEKRETPLRPQDVADAVQDVLVVVWRRLPEFRGESTLETWIYRICMLVMMNAFRRSQRDDGRRASDDALDSHPSGDDGSQGWIDREELDKEMDDLPRQEREAIRLRHFGELPFAEVAGRLGVSIRTAKARYYEGMKRLREQLRRGEGDE